MITYRAMLDVRHVVDYLSRLLAGHRRWIGTPRRSRVLGTFRQAVLVLRWFRDRTCVHCLAAGFGISQATAYRYLHEGIAEPGSTHDITAARIHALPAPYPAAAHGLPTLADSGYQGAGIGVITPIKHRPGPPLDPANQTHNTLHRATRALGERTVAVLKQRFRTLEHITLSPSRIGDITRVALTLHHT